MVQSVCIPFAFVWCVTVSGLTIACSILLSMATTLAPEALQEKDKQAVSQQLRALEKYKCVTQSRKDGDTGVNSVSETKRKKENGLPHPHHHHPPPHLLSRELFAHLAD